MDFKGQRKHLTSTPLPTQLQGASSIVRHHEYLFIGGDGILLLAATPTGVFVSSDEGATWTMRDKDMRAGCLGSDGKNLLAFTGSDMFASADAGSSWQKISTEVGLSAGSFFTTRFTTNTKYLFAGIGNWVWRYAR